MEILSHTSLFVHILAGALTLLAGPLAIYFNTRHLQRHRLAGKVFFYAMLVVCISAVGGYLKQPEQVFYQFLMGISALVLANILRGVRAIRLMKGGRIGVFDWAGVGLLALIGLWMSGMALSLSREGAALAFTLLFGVFGGASLLDVAGHLPKLLRPERLHRLDWLRVHVASMLGAFIASTTAFTVNAAPFLPWYLQWFGPTFLLVPLQVYFGRKLQAQKKQALHGAVLAG
ncbi:MAG: hypothetical protein IT260_10150 [Saprospiraceae bacterium]|nr:hypothetical protein [Saprospiraceae bacterium]